MGRFEYPCPICGLIQKTREASQVGLPCAAHSEKEIQAYFEREAEKDPELKELIEADKKDARAKVESKKG